MLYMTIADDATHVSIADARANLRDLMDRVQNGHARFTITRNGEPGAVLISQDELDSLEETLDILSDPEEVAAIRQGMAEADRGELHPLEDVLRELGL